MKGSLDYRLWRWHDYLLQSIIDLSLSCEGKEFCHHPLQLLLNPFLKDVPAWWSSFNYIDGSLDLDLIAPAKQVQMPIQHLKWTADLLSASCILKKQGNGPNQVRKPPVSQSYQIDKDDFIVSSPCQMCRTIIDTFNWTVGQWRDLQFLLYFRSYLAHFSCLLGVPDSLCTI